MHCVHTALLSGYFIRLTFAAIPFVIRGEFYFLYGARNVVFRGAYVIAPRAGRIASR